MRTQDSGRSTNSRMFENPLMFAGLGGAGIPLGLQLLGRARYRGVEGGAMRFLEHAAPHHAMGSQLREATLLALRMATVGLLTVALARPVLQSSDAPGAGRVTAAIVIDRSPSMSIEDN